MQDKFFELASGFELSSLWAFIFLVLANLLALFIAQVSFPLQLKMRISEWEKKRNAKDEFIEAVSRIDFIARGCLDSEYGEKFSFAGLSLSETEDEILSILRRMHNGGQKIRPYLSRSERKLFDKFLHQSSLAYDEAKETYGQWYQDDHMAIEQHSLNLIGAQAEIAGRILQSLVSK